MALTESNMMALGTKAPDFTLPNVVSGKKLNLKDLKSNKGTVVMFICNHCPYVIHVREGLLKVVREYSAKDISFIAINSNDVKNYPDDSPENMKKQALKYDYPFPYLFDETQNTAKAYQAACTPDFYVFDKNLKCVYRGRMDDSRPESGTPVTGKDLRRALDCLLAGKPVDPNQLPSMGCNIKWKTSA